MDRLRRRQEETKDEDEKEKPVGRQRTRRGRTDSNNSEEEGERAEREKARSKAKDDDDKDKEEEEGGRTRRGRRKAKDDDDDKDKEEEREREGRGLRVKLPMSTESEDEGKRETNNEEIGVDKVKEMEDRKREMRRRRSRLPADKQPEVYISGEILGGSGFGEGVSLVWQIQSESNWVYLDGAEQGQTQYDYPSNGRDAVWCHPLSVHYATNSMQGWPKILMQVWRLDYFGRSELVAYGFTHIPSLPGEVDVECRLWRPKGTLSDEIAGIYLGGVPRLKNWDLLFSKAWEQRPKLVTVGSGVVKMRLNILLRYFDDQKVEWSYSSLPSQDTASQQINNQAVNDEDL